MSTKTSPERFTFTQLSPAGGAQDDGPLIIDGLSQTPKRLPSKYFYDELGSDLFEQICELPEYYPTRTEEGILAAHAGDIAATTGACEVIELGSGSSRETPMLLGAYERHGHPLDYVPIDVNGDMVRASAAPLLERFDGLRVRGIGGTYEQALAEIRTAGPDGDDARPAQRMVVFLGSTIGNFLPAQIGGFLDRLHRALDPGDFFLVGTDLQKDPAILEAAYNDSDGVTAEFNLNMLRHLNRRFRGDFVLSKFRHFAYYNRELDQIEMHLESETDQLVSLSALNFDFRLGAGEKIRTEVSRKFNVGQLSGTMAAHGFQQITSWTDDNNWFAVTLSQRV